MKVNTIFLDMDGVIVDLLKGMCDNLEFDYQKVLQKWPTTAYRLIDGMGVEKDRYKQFLNDADNKFWATLPEYPWAKDIFHYLNKKYTVYILSCPTENSQSHAGKIEWLQNFVGDINWVLDRTVLSKNKSLLAKNERCVLIDDKCDNIDAFEKAGGSTIMFPQPWNDNRNTIMSDPLEFIMEHLEGLKCTTCGMRGCKSGCFYD